MLNFYFLPAHSRAIANYNCRMFFGNDELLKTRKIINFPVIFENTFYTCRISKITLLLREGYFMDFRFQNRFALNWTMNSWNVLNRLVVNLITRESLAWSRASRIHRRAIFKRVGKQIKKEKSNLNKQTSQQTWTERREPRPYTRLSIKWKSQAKNTPSFRN